ncbi:hypothetical protein WJX79_005558 [Trebouxia sp. C0005]
MRWSEWQGFKWHYRQSQLQVRRKCRVHLVRHSQELISQTEVEIDAGSLSIYPLQEQDERGTAILLTRAFSHTKDGRGFREIRQYVHEMLKSPPDGVMLVARLTPTDLSEIQLGKTSLVVGLAALSFNSATREQMPTLQPPDKAAYLSNIAVEPRYRRKGIASALLKVCEQVTQDALLNRLYLHARVADVGAQTFYRNAGYLEEGRDGSLNAMWHRISPRVLLCKALPVID